MVIDMIFMDQMMPRMTGSEASMAIRKLGYNGPIIAVTGSALSEDAEYMLSHGIDRVLTKPLNVEDVTAVIYGNG